jgi:hypothetical protein
MNAMKELLETRRLIRLEIEKVDELLKSTGQSLAIVAPREIPVQSPLKPIKKLPAFEKKVVMKPLVLTIIKEAGQPLGEDEIAIQLIQKGFDTDLPPEELVNNIYNEAINPLIQEGAIAPVGHRPNRKYKSC